MSKPVPIKNRAPLRSSALLALDKALPLETIAELARMQFPPQDLPEKFWPKILEDCKTALERLPTIDVIDRALAVLDAALTVRTERAVREHIGVMIGSFPNPRPPSPEIYVDALIFDAMDSEIPDGIVALACQEIRRTSEFVPTVKRFLDQAEMLRRKWQVARDHSLPRVRDLRVAYEIEVHVLTSDDGLWFDEKWRAPGA